MLVVMQEGATEPQIQAVIDRLVDLGFNVHRSTGVMHTVLGGVGGRGRFDPADFEVMEGVKEATASSRRTSWPAAASARVGPWSNRRCGDRRRAGGGDGRSVQRGERGSDRAYRRGGGARRGRASFAAAPSSRAVRPTAFRDWAKRGCNCCARRPTGTASWWSAK